jgi:hypothetical protein
VDEIQEQTEAQRINMGIAMQVGMAVYHYNDLNPYFLLVDEGFTAVDWSLNYGKFHSRGEIECDTLEQALGFVPDWVNDDRLALQLVEGEMLFFRIEHNKGWWTVTIGRKRGSSGKAVEGYESLSGAICRAYCTYHKIDLTQPVELPVL